jgi:hypothetical protein
MVLKSLQGVYSYCVVCSYFSLSKLLSRSLQSLLRLARHWIHAFAKHKFVRVFLPVPCVAYVQMVPVRTPLRTHPFLRSRCREAWGGSE